MKRWTRGVLYLFHNLSLPSQLLHRYQNVLLGDSEVAMGLAWWAKSRNPRVDGPRVRGKK